MKLSAFHETPYGYEAVSPDSEHRYVVVHNGIDFDVTHYWAQNPVGELIAQSTSYPTSKAREHYFNLQKSN